MRIRCMYIAMGYEYLNLDQVLCVDALPILISLSGLLCVNGAYRNFDL